MIPRVANFLGHVVRGESELWVDYGEMIFCGQRTAPTPRVLEVVISEMFDVHHLYIYIYVTNMSPLFALLKGRFRY